MANNTKQEDYGVYDFSTAGFDSFLDRSIDSNGGYTLDSQPIARSREMNFDQGKVSGSMGDSLRIGRIALDGRNGRISIFDENNTDENTRIGDLGD